MALFLSVLSATSLASQQQQVHVQPYGANAIRVRIWPAGATPSLTNAGYLLPPPASADPGAWLGGAAGARTASGNIEAVATPGGFAIRRVSDNATLLAQRSPLAVGDASADGRAPMNISLSVGTTPSAALRFFGGGCRCGGGFTPADGHDGGGMLNAGRNGSKGASADLHFGVPIGLAPSPRGIQGGVGSQCGMMNGMPWVLAGSTSHDAQFGLFVNTLGWTYGTASAARASLELLATRAAAVDIVVVTTGAKLPKAGSSRALELQRWYADALGHVPKMDRSVVGYWHSKDSIASQAEAESIVAGFSQRNLHVDVLVVRRVNRAAASPTASAPADLHSTYSSTTSTKPATAAPPSRSRPGPMPRRWSPNSKLTEPT